MIEEKLIEMKSKEKFIYMNENLSKNLKKSIKGTLI